MAKLDIGVISKEDGIVSKEEILIALKEIHARYCIPASEQNYTDKDYACMQYEKLIIHLQKEIDRLNNIIKELSKDVDMWNKKYNEQFDIIKELKKWLEEITYGMNEIPTYLEWENK